MSAPEFDGAPMTKREVLIARQAFIAGLNAQPGVGEPWAGTFEETQRRYPLPTVIRPRVWLEPQCVGGMAWRAVGGELQYTLSLRSDLLRWLPVDPKSCEHEITPDRIRAWADLLANPTEEVEA